MLDDLYQARLEEVWRAKVLMKLGSITPFGPTEFAVCNGSDVCKGVVLIAFQEKA